MQKAIDYYLNLPYKIEIITIPPEEGGGFMARLPQFGELGIVGDGETQEEALHDLEESKRARFQYYLDNYMSIPEPESEDAQYSGKFLLRLPTWLHGELAREADKNGVSLNQHVSALLASRLSVARLSESVAGMAAEIREIKHRMCSISYHVAMSNLTVSSYESMFKPPVTFEGTGDPWPKEIENAA